MRRLYSTFAGGRPGIGLLLMRLVVGSALIVRTYPTFHGHPTLNASISSVFQVVFGILLILGLWTPIVGTFVAVIEIWYLMKVVGDPWVPFLLASIAAGLGMVGPGLWSMDAHLFGWKRVEVPPRTSSPKSL